jgi:ankyrin repeat protein
VFLSNHKQAKNALVTLLFATACIFTNQPGFAAVNDKIKLFDGWSELMYASWKGNKEVVKKLLEAGSNLKEKDEDGRTALHYASWWGQPEIIRLLLSQGADINDADNRGETPLILAARNGKDEAIKQLVAS